MAAQTPTNDIDRTGVGGTLDPDSIYAPLPQNWYEALPYGFQFTPRGTTKAITMYLPIQPYNLNIQTHFATNVVTTLYGTVEEHSDQRYFTISIEGTTSMVPQYYDTVSNQTSDTSAIPGYVPGRVSFPVKDTLNLGGFFQKTIGVGTQIINSASAAINGVQKALGNSSTPKNLTGVDVSKTGYMAFHNLYRFFLNYKKDTSGESSTAPRMRHPLVFFNYKDGNKYRCAITSFVLKRSVETPMLYNYSIVLRAYQIQGLNSDEVKTQSINDRLAALGLSGVDNSSTFNNIKNISKNAKDAVGGLIGGVNILGG